MGLVLRQGARVRHDLVATIRSPDVLRLKQGMSRARV